MSGTVNTGSGEGSGGIGGMGGPGTEVGFLRRVWASQTWMGALGALLVAIAFSLAAWQASGSRAREPLRLSAGVVKGGPDLSGGQIVQVTYNVPDGGTRLVAHLGLLRQQPADCLRAGTVELSAVSGTDDPMWHRSLPAAESIITPVHVETSAASVVLSVRLSTLGECRTEVTAAPYWVEYGPSDAEFIAFLAGEASLLLASFVPWLRWLYLRRIGLRREEAAEREARTRLRAAEAQLVEEVRQSAVAPDDADPLALPGLWKVTHERLYVYHELATRQAAKSFRNAQTAMTAGFCLLAGFTVLAIVARNPTASVVAGALGVTSAGLGGYVSRTFVRSQENAAAHLRAYFDQPLEFSRFLAAERLIAKADLSGEQRALILGDLIHLMLTPGAPTSAPPPNSGQEDSPDP